MTDDSKSSQSAFGELYPIARGRFGQVRGGTLGGGFHSLHNKPLLEDADNERGFLSKKDRRHILETVNLNLSDASERNARRRIRNRVLYSYFDARYLRYIADRDRELIFDNARDAGYDLHFREGFKEFVRFTYLGLLENDYDIDILEILEAAIREAEEEYALDAARNVNFDVNIQVTETERDSVEELERRYHQREKLNRNELAVLVNSEHTNENDDVADAADIDLADALYYDARQPESDPHGYSWEDPDREEAEEIVEWLRSVFEEYNISSYDDLEISMDRLTVVDEELGEQLKKKVNRLSRAAPNFESQLALEADLREADMALLHDILWNPDSKDVETALADKARPPTAGEEWDPAEDEYFQKFIARVQAAREANGVFTSGGEEGRERWNEVLRLAEFDKEEWSEYLQEQRVSRCVNALQEDIDSSDLTAEDLRSADSFEDQKSLLAEKGAENAYWLTVKCNEDVLADAIRIVAGTGVTGCHD